MEDISSEIRVRLWNIQIIDAYHCSAKVVLDRVEKTNRQLVSSITHFFLLHFLSFWFGLFPHCFLANSTHYLLLQLLLLESVGSGFEILLAWLRGTVFYLFLWCFFMIDDVMHDFWMNLNNLLMPLLSDLRFRVHKKSRNDGVHVGVEVVFTLPLENVSDILFIDSGHGGL